MYHAERGLAPFADRRHTWAVKIENKTRSVNQLGALVASFLKDGQLRVSVFPEGEKFFVGAPTVRHIVCKSVASCCSQVCQRHQRRFRIDSAMIDYFLKLA
jgi:hypothetical protein